MLDQWYQQIFISSICVETCRVNDFFHVTASALDPYPDGDYDPRYHDSLSNTVGMIVLYLFHDGTSGIVSTCTGLR